MIKAARLSFLVVFLLLYCVDSSSASGAVKFGYDFAGNHKVSGSGNTATEEVQPAPSATGEIFKSFNENFDLGAGVTFQLPRSQVNYNGSFSFVPFYGMVRVRLKPYDVFSPHFTGHLGYNIFHGSSDYKGSANLDGGLYYGIGAGVIKENFLIEILYSINNGTIEYRGDPYDIEYSTFTIQWGIIF